MNEEGKGIQKQGSRDLGVISRSLSVADVEPMTVGDLEAAMLLLLPAEDAEEWDRTGLLVGDPAVRVTRVAVALDATVEAVLAAAKAGANVLVTHHPAYLTAPDSFKPAASSAVVSGAVVWTAIRSGVALMNFHTALDVNPRAQAVLPGLLGLRFQRVLQPTSQDGEKGYGQVCSIPAGETLTLAMLARRCEAAFGRPARVWGDVGRTLRSVATCTGSEGGNARACLASGIDCLVCGEIKYHEALDVSQAGLAILELGHDVSELPLCGALAQVLCQVGIDPDDMVMLPQQQNWSVVSAAVRA